MRLKKQQKAFLLFEVLIAVLVLSVGITFVLRSFNSAIMTIKGLKEYMTAISLLEQKMSQIEIDGVDKVAFQGRFAGDMEKFSWKIDLSKSQELPLDKVGVTIIWNTQNSSRYISADTYLRQGPGLPS